MKRKASMNILSQVILLPILFLISLVLIVELDNYYEDEKEGDKAEIKERIEKYAIQCYASEGIYPKDLEYLEEEYGLIIDHSSYFIDYDLFASNIMPEITVFDEDDYEGE